MSDPIFEQAHFGSPFDWFTIVFFLFFFLTLGVILFTVFKGIKQWSYNNKQPVLTVPAHLVTKRTDVSQHSSSPAHHHTDTVHHSSHHSSTSYYATFEVESGDRMEFVVSSKEFGQIVEGDVGHLTFQGTRYHQFERLSNKSSLAD
ncbi:DUF2500 domain-containing protein [Alkalihalobacillus pseudalcaliphilus]|uniref:DUF2500 domain-containing protein n=1 Tax=Alkalihalobacillus pseudalcaliphilus TaxID=79884 RepID=UPI00064D92D3|nr:DUF2500 domain-containing protein [Alkalihalobacillus pseudalcaliphilus]KMK75758.1 hypothetical protein AB990_10820 [Alkalihalobacillus pseudalcaliphilus]